MANNKEFGLWSEVPSGHVAAWGARAIFKNGHVDIVANRQGFAGPDHVCSALSEHINLALPVIHERARDLMGRDDEIVTLCDEPGLVVRGRAAGGYLYLAAWIPEVDVDDGTWTGSGPVPEIGDEVTSRSSYPASKHKVLARFVDHGYVGIVTAPMSPDREWVRDVLREGWTPTCTLFGRELA